MVPVLANDHRCGWQRAVLVEREPGTRYEITALALAPGAPDLHVSLCVHSTEEDRPQEIFSCCFQKHIYFVFTILGILSITQLGSSAV